MISPIIALLYVLIMTNKIQHLHILGICGTFMGGIAAIAKQLGFKVSGSDANVYPPMSTQLEQLGIELMSGYQVDNFSDDIDLVIVGNAMSRGNPMVEYMLDRNIPYTSGPQWLLENVLKDRWVLAVSGTHGKTTTSSMLAWILEYAHMSPGFLIGGVPQNFSSSARLGDTPFFVIEADEYDCAFFDKRSKFVHYRPRTLVINNLEFDHGDIFNDLSDIQKQFHHLIRMVPSNGLILSPANEVAISETLAMGCWTSTEFSKQEPQQDSQLDTGWQAEKLNAQGSEFIVEFNGKEQGVVKWDLIGDFNIDNLLAAITVLLVEGVPLAKIAENVANIKPIAGRMEVFSAKCQTEKSATAVVDYAHTPDALAKALIACRQHCSGELTIVFGCGGDRDKGKRPLMAKAAEKYADKIVVTSDNPRTENAQNIVDDVLAGLSNKIKSASKKLTVNLDRKQAVLDALTQSKTNDIVLLAGKGHEDYVIVAQYNDDGKVDRKSVV